MKLVFGSWYLVLGKALRPSADWDWVWDWVALGPPKGHPSVTQGRPKRGFVQVPLLAIKVEKMAGWGALKIAEIAKIG